MYMKTLYMDSYCEYNITGLRILLKDPVPPSQQQFFPDSVLIRSFISSSFALIALLNYDSIDIDIVGNIRIMIC